MEAKFCKTAIDISKFLFLKETHPTLSYVGYTQNESSWPNYSSESTFGVQTSALDTVISAELKAHQLKLMALARKDLAKFCSTKKQQQFLYTYRKEIEITGRPADGFLGNSRYGMSHNA